VKIAREVREMLHTASIRERLTQREALGLCTNACFDASSPLSPTRNNRGETMKAMLMAAAGGPKCSRQPTFRRRKRAERSAGAAARRRHQSARHQGAQAQHVLPNELPSVLGCDGAGTVEAVGSAVRRFKPGDDVYFFNNGLGSGPGNYAEYTVVRED
jgi:hypothetical protein